MLLFSSTDTVKWSFPLY